jgi:hypothetical protein
LRTRAEISSVNNRLFIMDKRLHDTVTLLPGHVNAPLS